MGISFDLETTIAAACAIVVALIFCIAAYAISDVGGRHYRRRFAAVRDRAHGITTVQTGVTRSLARQQSATPKIDRVAHQWLPRRDVLAARLARTGRSISVGQYAMVSLGLAAMTAIGCAVAAGIGFI